MLAVVAGEEAAVVDWGGALMGGLMGGQNMLAIQRQRLAEQDEQRLAADSEVNRRQAFFNMRLEGQLAPLRKQLLQGDISLRQLNIAEAKANLGVLFKDIKSREKNRELNETLDILERKGNINKMLTDVDESKARAEESRASGRLKGATAQGVEDDNALFAQFNTFLDSEDGAAAVEKQGNLQAGNGLTEGLWQMLGKDGSPPGSLYDLINGDFQSLMDKAVESGLPVNDATRGDVYKKLLERYQPYLQSMLPSQAQPVLPGASAPAQAPTGMIRHLGPNLPLMSQPPIPASVIGSGGYVNPQRFDFGGGDTPFDQAMALRQFLRGAQSGP